ncbi:WG repeat-containing protein [Paenibacillus sp. TRM 82003]|nr:WG repeat-containing protein [Paenibacillus sp. TRM 82003]
MKLRISLLLCFALVFGLVPATYAQEEDTFAIQPQFAHIPHYNYDFNAFNEGVAWVRLTKSGNMGVINRAGNLLFDGYYLAPNSFTTYVFSEGLSRAKNDAGDWLYVDKAGNVLLETDYDVVLNFREGLAAVMKNGKWGFIDRTGYEIVKPQYDEVRDDDGYGVSSGTSGFYEGLAAVSKNGKWGFIDRKGKEVIKPKYEWAFNFYEGLAVVTNNGKWGYIDQTGKEVIALKYDEVVSFSEGLGVVLLDSEDGYRWGFVNKNGKVVADFNDKYSFVRSFKEGIAIARYVDRNYGFVLINKSGKVVADLGSKYDDVKDFDEGLAYVEKGGKFGFINSTGKEVIKPIYDDAKGSSNGLIGVSLESNTDTFGFLANPLDLPSSWATSEIEVASTLNIIPLDIDYGYKNEITRAEFSKLALQVLMVARNQSIDELLSNAINKHDSSKIVDSYDPEILAAYSLGIILGKGNSKLDPNGLITRQEASVMIARIANMLNMPKASTGLSFADNASIASWAKDSVALVTSIKDNTNNTPVLSSVGNNIFAPHATYTKQQAFISMKRLINALVN